MNEGLLGWKIPKRYNSYQEDTKYSLNTREFIPKSQNQDNQKHINNKKSNCSQSSLMSDKFKQLVARSQTLSQISCFSGSQVLTAGAPLTVCSIDAAGVNGSKFSSDCSKLFGKAEFEIDAHSDYDQDDIHCRSEENELHSEILNKYSTANYKESQFAASQSFKSPNHRKSESTIIYNSCVPDISCSVSLWVAKENRRTLKGESIEESCLNQSYFNVAKEYTQSSVSRLNSIIKKIQELNEKNSEIKCDRIRNRYSKFINQKLRLISNTPCAITNLRCEGDLIECSHSDNPSSVISYNSQSPSLYSFEGDKFYFKDGCFQSQEQISIMISLDYHFPSVLLVGTLTGKLLLFKKAQSQRMYEQKEEVHLFTKNSSAYATSLCQYKSNFFVGGSDGSLLIFDFKTKDISYLIEGEQELEYASKGQEESPIPTRQRSQFASPELKPTEQQQVEFSEKNLESSAKLQFHFSDLNINGKRANSAEAGMQDDRSVSPQDSKSAQKRFEFSSFFPDNKGEGQRQNKEVKGIKVDSNNIVFWNGNGQVKVLKNDQSKAIIFETEIDGLIKCSLSSECNNQLIVLSEERLVIWYIPKSKIIFRKKANVQEFMAFKDMAINSKTKEIVVLSVNEMMQQSKIEILSNSSSKLRQIDCISTSYLIKQVLFDKSRELIFISTKDELMAFHFYNKKSHATIKRELLESMEE